MLFGLRVKKFTLLADNKAFALTFAFFCFLLRG